MKIRVRASSPEQAVQELLMHCRSTRPNTDLLSTDSTVGWMMRRMIDAVGFWMRSAELEIDVEELAEMDFQILERAWVALGAEMDRRGQMCERRLGNMTCKLSRGHGGLCTDGAASW